MPDTAQIDIAALEQIIDQAFENRSQISSSNVDVELQEAINSAISLLNNGKLRVASKEDGQWLVHQWLKKAVLLYFCIMDNKPLSTGAMQYFDKVPLKYSAGAQQDTSFTGGVRVVPPACARYGAYIGAGSVLMPS